MLNIQLFGRIPYCTWQPYGGELATNDQVPTLLTVVVESGTDLDEEVGYTRHGDFLDGK